MAQIADIFEVQYQAVSRWLDDWEDYGIRGLYKTRGGGKKPIYNAAEEQRIKELVAEEPRRISVFSQKVLERG